VGLTQPALYHHFATKEDLYVAVALGEVTRLRAGIERIVRRDGPARERLVALARFMLTTVDYNFPLMYHDMGNEIGEKARATLGTAFFGGIIGPLAGLFAAGQAAGELRGAGAGGLTPADSAGLFMAFVAHFLDRPLTHEQILSVRGTEASATRLVELLLGGLGADG
jgi:AcrR family transcriptional regulator